MSMERIPETNDIIYMNYDMLVLLNDRAVSKQYNRSFFLDKLPIRKDDLFPITEAFLHNDVNIRCKLILNRVGDTGWLDIGVNDYNKLPRADTQDGEVLVDVPQEYADWHWKVMGEEIGTLAEWFNKSEETNS